MSWNTTTAVNGAHALTAVARDAAGNKTTSAAVTVTVSNVATPPPPPGAILFESNWAAAIGTTQAAFTDNGAWTGYVQFDTANPTMAVVTGGPKGLNALRATQNGPIWGTDVWKANFATAGQDYYLRFYFRNDDASSAGDHIVTVGTMVGGASVDNLTYLRKYGGPSDFAFAGSGCVSMNSPATPVAIAARASTGTNSRCPPDLVPCPPGS